METPKITAYLKTTCGWSAGVRAVLAKYNLPYTEKDIIQNPAFRWEMETKTGQPLSPCVEINDKMLADVSGDEVEAVSASRKARAAERGRGRGADQCALRARAARQRGADASLRAVKALSMTLKRLKRCIALTLQRSNAATL